MKSVLIPYLFRIDRGGELGAKVVIIWFITLPVIRLAVSERMVFLKGHQDRFFQASRRAASAAGKSSRERTMISRP